MKEICPICGHDLTVLVEKAGWGDRLTVKLFHSMLHVHRIVTGEDPMPVPYGDNFREGLAEVMDCLADNWMRDC